MTRKLKRSLWEDEDVHPYGATEEQFGSLVDWVAFASLLSVHFSFCSTFGFLFVDCASESLGLALVCFGFGIMFFDVSLYLTFQSSVPGFIATWGVETVDCLTVAEAFGQWQSDSKSHPMSRRESSG